jgi:hypothetical protein
MPQRLWHHGAIGLLCFTHYYSGVFVMKINFCSAPCGSGKTYQIIKRACEWAKTGRRIIILQPTKELIEKTVQEELLMAAKLSQTASEASEVRIMTSKERAFSKRPFNFEQFGQSCPSDVPDNISIDYAITHLSSSER